MMMAEEREGHLWTDNRGTGNFAKTGMRIGFDDGRRGSLHANASHVMLTTIHLALDVNLLFERRTDLCCMT